ncbi:ABC-three component system middle component 1 [Psychromonas sp. Urea-02u-13]|uniref:ABC-three component system middle component 1 n=1 Tax=Psychromonas sp. Urea-02u-13 TaxID=2058326 RepID=UPI000C341640|nr:ABC-three component system middle component 1 [Psychromonas sp. Urea-02u-13]PKG37073.1 hypothetical protein CXF74_20805 [Psychromonas sp. Urea-02u-13]
MINFLKKVFLERDYIISNQHITDEYFDITFIEGNISVNKEEYYLLVQSKGILDDCIKLLLEKKIEEFESKIKPIKAGAIKNCTLILCAEANSLDISKVLMFEEDPFSFKKNVITYTQSQLSNLIEIVGEERFSDSFIGLMLSASNGKKFDSFKEGKINNHDYYNLIMMLMIKLPFLKYSNNAAELYDVESVINANLNSSQLPVKENCLSLSLDDLNDDELVKIILDWEK